MQTADVHAGEATIDENTQGFQEQGITTALEKKLPLLRFLHNQPPAVQPSQVFTAYGPVPKKEENPSSTPAVRLYCESRVYLFAHAYVSLILSPYALPSATPEAS